MKRIGNIDGVKLYDIICSRENIEEAVKLACKDHGDDVAVRRIREDPEPYINAAQEILLNRSFHYSKFKEKDIWERGKHRHLVFTRTFPDRIIQHAVFNVVAPILHATVIPNEFAAVKGRGTHKCSMVVRRDLQKDWRHTWFCLKIDVSKFFDNIDRDILFGMLKRKLKCRETLDILHKIVFDVPGEKGLPIGLFSSQILSVMYLAGFDRYCKERLGIRHYYRYMDDIVILASNKNILHSCLAFMEGELAGIKLAVKGNWAIFPVEKRRVDFVGFVHNHTSVAVRKRTAIRYRRTCNVIISAVRKRIPVTMHMLLSKQSYEGIIGWATAGSLVNIYSVRADMALIFGVGSI